MSLVGVGVFRLFPKKNRKNIEFRENTENNLKKKNTRTTLLVQIDLYI